MTQQQGREPESLEMNLEIENANNVCSLYVEGFDVDMKYFFLHDFQGQRQEEAQPPTVPQQAQSIPPGFGAVRGVSNSHESIRHSPTNSADKRRDTGAVLIAKNIKHHGAMWARDKLSPSVWIVDIEKVKKVVKYNNTECYVYLLNLQLKSLMIKSVLPRCT